MFKALKELFFGKAPQKEEQSVAPYKVEIQQSEPAPVEAPPMAERRQNQPEVAVPLLVEVNTAKVEPKKTTRKKAEPKVVAKPKAEKAVSAAKPAAIKAAPKKAPVKKSVAPAGISSPKPRKPKKSV